MRNYLIIFFIALIFCSCKSSFKVTDKPIDYSTVIVKGKIKGIIFSKDADCFMCLLEKHRFSPSLSEIEKAEEILKTKLKEINSPLINQGGNCPVIHNELKQYRRQYFGYYHSNGERIIFTTFNWNRYTIFDFLKGYSKSDLSKWKTEIETFLDGCSNHWEIKINLDAQQLFDLNINGS